MQNLEECFTCGGTGIDPDWFGCNDAQCCGRPTSCDTCDGDGHLATEEQSS